MTGFRLQRGGRIDRSRPLSFTFDGRRLYGFAGDTLASALLANGIGALGRSFKYRRPRGIVAAGCDEPNALLRVGVGSRATPNLRATEVELYDGLVARSQNCWPRPGFDLSAGLAALAPLLVAGFYYKTFMWPPSWWRRVYEPVLRHLAGLGVAPAAPDPDTYDKMHAHTDVLVVGGGPAGLSAALAAARAGARVMLADEQAEPGGGLLAAAERVEDRPAPEWVAAAVAELRSLPETVVLPRTTAFGYYDQNYLMLAERRTDHLGAAAPSGVARQRLWHVRARHVVLATGAHERPMIFPDNDRPGIMLASAAACYATRYGVAAGRRAVMFTNHDGAYADAFALAEAGIDVAAIVDVRRQVEPSLAAEAERRRIDLFAGSTVVGVSGRRRVTAATIAAIDPDRDAPPARRRIACDLIAMSAGWAPAVHLFSQSQGRLRWDEARACFVPGTASQPQSSAGGVNATFGLANCLAEGAAAGLAAASACGFAPETGPRFVAARPAEAAVGPPVPHPKQHAGAGDRRAFVDFQHDVTAADIALAAREGLTSVEHIKRYTTVGMATDQGKTSNANALALLAENTGRAAGEIGTTTFRPPYTPVCFGALAGRERAELFDPVRVTPMHRWHVDRGAAFENVGQWRRPWYYPQAGEDRDAATRREAAAVRSGVGVQDVSTLGKIELRGPDAATLLDRLYTNAFSTLEVGRCRYGLMCRDDGMVFDDGVTTRLGPDHFYMTTTSGGAARVLDWLEEWLQTEWPDLRVYVTSVTEQWAAAAIAGPHARDVLRALAPGMDLGRDAFPFLAMREGCVAGIEARLFRISFSGELAYEINVPADYGLALWHAIMAAGERFGIVPYGTEAMHLLRAEKGFPIVGQDTDGTVTPFDLGLGRLVSRRKDFLGHRSLARADTARPDRKQLVGLLPEDPNAVLAEGAALVAPPPGPPAVLLGHVTSSYWSPNLGRSFALALVKDGRRRMGQTVFAPLSGRGVAARIVEPVFWDPAGERQNG
ncbi:MAG: sarcosine oxidase subunit alpha family protein [Alphaproteobacteria bacterium]|nr:sarcosine oxidase subunit alpha family protein [Alphaproteobacteria bacterium]